MYPLPSHQLRRTRRIKYHLTLILLWKLEGQKSDLHYKTSLLPWPTKRKKLTPNLQFHRKADYLLLEQWTKADLQLQVQEELNVFDSNYHAFRKCRLILIFLTFSMVKQLISSLLVIMSCEYFNWYEYIDLIII